MHFEYHSVDYSMHQWMKKKRVLKEVRVGL